MFNVSKGTTGDMSEVDVSKRNFRHVFCLSPLFFSVIFFTSFKKRKKKMETPYKIHYPVTVIGHMCVCVNVCTMNAFLLSLVFASFTRILSIVLS